MPPPSRSAAPGAPTAALTGTALTIGGHTLLAGVPPSVTSSPGPLPGSLVLGLDLGVGGDTAQADVVLGKLAVTR